MPLRFARFLVKVLKTLRTLAIFVKKPLKTLIHVHLTFKNRKVFIGFFTKNANVITFFNTFWIEINEFGPAGGRWRSSELDLQDLVNLRVRTLARKGNIQSRAVRWFRVGGSQTRPRR